MSSNLKYITVNPNNQSATLVVAGAQQSREFLIPSSVYSLKDSVFRGAISAAATGNVPKLNVEMPPISEFSLRLPNGTDLFTVRNFDIYMKHVRKATTSNQDYIKNGPIVPATLNKTCFLNCSQTPYGTALASDVSSNVFALQTGAASGAIGANNGAFGGLLQNRWAEGAATPADYVFFLRLGDIPHSIFACDKNFFIPEGSRLVVTFRPAAQTGVNAGAGALGFNGLTSATYSNLSMEFAEEQNEARRAEAMSRASRGDVIPTVYEFSNAIGIQTAATSTTVLDSGIVGSNLLRVYSVLAGAGAGAGWGVSETVSANGGLLTILNKIGNHYTRDQPVTIATEGWDLMFSKLQNSAFQGERDYRISPVWCDEFSDGVDLTKTRWTDCDEDSYGMGLSGPISWSSRITKGITSADIYHWFVAQRKVFMNAGILQ